MRIALLFGGKSPEHQISVRSARNIAGAIDRSKHELLLIGVDPRGGWRLLEEVPAVSVGEEAPQLALVPGRESGQIVRLDNLQPLPQLDAFFLIIHGPNGEDGTMQGLLRSLDLPFVGPDVLGSAVAMDKDVAKRLLRQAGLKVARDMVFFQHEKDAIDYAAIRNQLGSPVFVKPANMGSSVGVHKVRNVEEFRHAIQDAFQYDRKIIVEEMIEGRELECAVLGNAVPEVSHVGEIVTEEEYSFEAKYVSDTAAQLLIPADVSKAALFQLQLVAKQAFQVLGCEGMSRVDMFLTEADDVYVNEVNTLPGFTNISMYPALWKHAGTSYSELVEELLRLAIERHQARKALKDARE
jgi:D-alanine-D-alanine ligase